MNKTEKDFQREITRLKQSYLDDQIKYELPFKHERNRNRFIQNLLHQQQTIINGSIIRYNISVICLQR
jgi:hypothetical protein